MTSKIEWTDDTWNPVTGCTKISEGCKNCYAENIAKRFWGKRPFGQIIMHHNRLTVPYKWKKPRRIFVPSMGDLGHEGVTTDFFHKVLRTTYNCPQHTFMILTKRPKAIAKDLASYYDHFKLLPNLWLGISTENQKRLEERMEHFAPIPAAIKFISYEPALDWIFIDEYAQSIDWVIAGSESGNGRRRSSPSRFRQVRDDCEHHGIPFFLKQMDVMGKLVKMPELDGRTWEGYPT